MNEYFVYIMSNNARTLYIGVTNDLQRRVMEHKQAVTTGFTTKYAITQLVWFESFSDINEAIEWEKKIKGWRRSKKLGLIESKNPHWFDLGDSWRVTPDPPPRSG